MDKPDLRQVLEHYHVELRGERRETQVLCPIHDEARPSCSVNLDKGVIHCMSCGFGGDSFAIIGEKEGLSEFPAIVQWAEEVLGFSRGDVPRATGRGGARLSRGKGSGFAPKYRNSSARRRPLSST